MCVVLRSAVAYIDGLFVLLKILAFEFEIRKSSRPQVRCCSGLRAWNTDQCINGVFSACFRNVAAQGVGFDV